MESSPASYHFGILTLISAAVRPRDTRRESHVNLGRRDSPRDGIGPITMGNLGYVLYAVAVQVVRMYRCVRRRWL